MHAQTSKAYTLSLGNCSSNIRPVEARLLTIAAGQALELSPPWELYVEDAAGQDGRYCWVTLQDALVRPGWWGPLAVAVVLGKFAHDLLHACIHACVLYMYHVCRVWGHAGWGRGPC